MVNRKCLFCEEEAIKSKYVCNACEEKLALMKQFKTIDRGQKKIEKAARSFYYKSISYAEEKEKIVAKMIDDGFRFNSADEVCLAMQFEKQNVRYFPNYKIGKHKVDFFLPDIKIIVEVDGEMYHTDDDKEFLRERSIMANVGESYEIVRVSAEYITDFMIYDTVDTLKFVRDKRKMDGHFRDTRYDGRYIIECWQLHKYLRRQKKNDN